jgi:Protein of unknown function (DUF1573)
MVGLMMLILLFLTSPAMPALSADAAHHHLGEARTGPDLRHVFVIRNTGSAPMTVDKVEGMCGCSTPRINKTHLAPGESTEVTLTVRTLMQPAGEQTWKATIHTATETLELRLSAKLVREISVTPNQVAISTTSSARQDITISDIRPKPLRIRSASTTHPKLKVSLARGMTYALEVPADFPVGHFREEVVFHTEDPACPELRVPITITKSATDRFRVLPAIPTIRFNPGESEASTVVQIRQTEPFTLQSATTTTTGLRLKTSTTTGIVGVVRVTAERVKLPSMTGQAVVHVKIGEETLTIPVVWE